MTPLDAPGKQAFWKHCGKRRNYSQRAISPFPTVFSTHLDNFLPFSSNLKLSSANSFSLEESKIFRLVVGLRYRDREDQILNLAKGNHSRFFRWTVNSFLHIYSFYHIGEKTFRKTLRKKVKLLKMSNFTFFSNVFYAILILKSFNSYMLVLVCSFFEFGTVWKLCIRDWLKTVSPVESEIERLVSPSKTEITKITRFKRFIFIIWIP